jgi:hypothetical protein
LHDELRGVLLLVEVKSGCHYRRCCTKNGTLRFIRPAVSDSPLHQHQLQALIGKDLFLRTYPHWKNEEGERSVEAAVVYVAASGDIELIPEPEFKVKYSPLLSEILYKTR